MANAVIAALMADILENDNKALGVLPKIIKRRLSKWQERCVQNVTGKLYGQKVLTLFVQIAAIK